MHPLIVELDAEQKRKEPLSDFAVGDTVDVHTRIKEGDKERVQVFTGTVIRRSASHNAPNATFTVRRIVDGQGVERVLPINSPKILEVVVKRRGRVRRAKLYYLRDRVGKKTKVKERLVVKADGAAKAKAAPKKAEAKAKAAPKKAEADAEQSGDGEEAAPASQD